MPGVNATRRRVAMSAGWLFAIAWGAFWIAVIATAVVVSWPIKKTPRRPDAD